MRTQILTLGLIAASLSCSTAQNWPSWRGDLEGSGIAAPQPVAGDWSKTKNVVWRHELPNRGNSTPIIWENKVFLTQVIEKDNFRTLMCLDRANGKKLWQKGVVYDKEESSHRTNPYCSASPSTDGERVIVSFASAGIYCYDLNGKELWKRDLGLQSHTWGNASSPVIHKDLCFIYHGPGKNSVFYALDKKTGKTVWKFDEPKWDTSSRTDGFRGRDNGIVGSFSTPIIVNAKGRDELIMSFPQQVKAFDPATGKELWHCKGLNPLVYTSPIYSDGIVVAMGGYSGDSLAVRVGGNGDVTKTHRLWHLSRHKGGIGSGVIHDGYVYFPNTSGGLAHCLELKTGATVWNERMRGPGNEPGVWSSYTLVGDKIYVINKSGDTIIFKASPKFEKVGVASVDEESNASLVVSNDEIFLRTHKALWCIGRGKATAMLK